MSHEPVLLKEVLVGLNLQLGETVLDATLNRGGHALAMGELLGSTGHLIGIEADAKAVAEAKEHLTGLECRVDLLVGNFRHLSALLDSLGIKKVGAVLFDLGLSSEQLVESERGFSFQISGPLKMTFSQVAGNGLTAEEVVNDWAEENLVTIIKSYGEENFAKSIAKEIVRVRKIAPIKTTFDLVSAISRGVPAWYRHRRLHFATKTFQAIRMTVNDELQALKEGLNNAWLLLAPDGRLAVICFHGLEARIVKHFFKEKVRQEEGELLNKKALKPTITEIKNNPRARSATLRILKKL